MKSSSLVLMAALSALLVPLAEASILTRTGTTAAAPTFNRPLEDLSALSSVGTAVLYDSYTFSVGAAGAYTFLSTGQFDTFSVLYSPALNPAAPLLNAQIANDDLVSFTTSGFERNLLPGINYTLVTAGFGNTDSGVFSTTIGGPGTITPAVPAGAPVSLPNLVTFTGSTAGAPTYNRTLEDFSALSSVGTAVRYDGYSFRVAVSGEYTFLSTGEFDTIAFLYAPALDPARPLVNGLIGNDDLVSFTTSGFAYGLVAGVDYTVVMAGFANADSGFYSTTIGGPGAIIATAVPEPEVWGLMVAGLAVVAARSRRRAARA